MNFKAMMLSAVVSFAAAMAVILPGKSDAVAESPINGNYREGRIVQASTVKKAPPQLKKAAKVSVYRVKQAISISKEEFDCLAKNIFHEAGVESREGKIAVAQVTFNRLREGQWGQKVCSVVYSKAQFSWTLDKKKRKEKPKGKLWDEAVNAAKDFLKGYRIRGLERSTFYHTDYITPPRWAATMRVATYFGQHIFFNAV